jgi:hypothetical protein
MNEFSQVPAEPPRAGAMAGEFVTETFDYDHGRQVTVYVPPVPSEAIVFVGDGQMISQWERSLEAADVPSTMIVGVHRAADGTFAALRVFTQIRSGTVRGTREIFRRGRRCVDAIAFRRSAAFRAHSGVWCFGKWRTGACSWSSTPRALRRDLLSLARRRVPAA